MPLSRYQIRNEYSLADPDLYKVADKDDPEALLEGVAMAGLVGVLRQLGDLAEFAAEIFHDLHEEVMATAARGHGLIVRVQQLEAEFPLVERTLLSQTFHTAFLYNSGTDWHPNSHMDESVVARGDLPRFVMDSYEECRGPPRLFLLDKFDVAGAGACLKRFTDPSFFKAEAISSSDKKSDGKREKRTRKGKRRGLRWRNGDTPEIFPSTHAKLHQLFLEELVETGGSDPDRRVKLKKRQFTGSLFDQEKRKSYMEKFVDCCSPEQKIVHEICIDALPLTWRSENGYESGLEIVEIDTVSPLKESIHSSPDAREMVVKPSLEGFNKDKLTDVINSENGQDPRFNHDSKISSAIYKLRSEEAFADRQSKSEISDDDGHYSDDVASEIDKYMDALATMESEGETDSECNKNPLYLNLKPIVIDSDASEGLREPHSLLMDPQSLGNSTASEDGNNFLKGRQSYSRSISENSLAEVTPYVDAAVGAVPSVAACNSDVDNISFQHHYTSKDACKSKTVVNSLAETSSYLDTIGSTVPSFLVSNPDADNISSGHHSTSEDIPEGKTEECAMGTTVAVEADEVTKTVQELGENTFNTARLTDPSTKLHSVYMEASLRNYSLLSLDLDDVCSNSAELDVSSEMSNPRHANQTTNSTFNRTVLDAPERVDSGDWSNAIQPRHGMASCSSSVYSETSPDTETTIDDLLQIKPKKADSASSSVEELINDIGMGDMAAIFDPIAPERIESTDGAPNFEVCITSTEEKSDYLYPASDSKQKFNNQEHSETTKATHMPPDYAEAPLPTSERDSSIKEVFVHVEDEEVASSTPIFGQTETFPLPVSSRLHTFVADISFSRTTDAAETAEYGSLEEAVASVVSYRDEPNCELSSGSAAVLEHCLAETGEQDTGNDTGKEQNSVSTSGTECKAGLNVVAFDRDAVCRDITSVCSNLPDSVETLEQLDRTETLAVEVDSTNGHDCSNISSSILAAQSDSDLHHDTGRVEHHENGIDASRQVDIDRHGNSSSLCDHHHPSNQDISAQPAILVPGSSKQLTIESTLFFPSDNMLSGTNQATLMEEDMGQPIKTRRLPGLGVTPAEPQINMDSPPLPPLPPMQWRLSRFQNSSAAIESVQPMTLPTICYEGSASTHTSNDVEKLGYSNDQAQLEVFTQSLPTPVTEVSLESNIDGIERKDLSLINQTFTRPHNGTQILEEPYQHSAILVEPELLVQDASGNDSPVRETKVDTENGIQNYQPEHVPWEMEQAEDSHVNYSPSSSVHYDWQPPPGLMAPETQRTWSSIYDGMPTDAGAYATGALQKKLPRPRNPLIVEVVAVDKRKLRKVERVKPSEESKREERESFLEQLQLRKVERFKPPAESKTQEGELLLEHLQLRKVKERIKKPVEPKSEDMELSLQQLQLRKVGESLKHPTELKTQEKESSLEQIQLRKVRERAKSEEKPEDTESLRVQLRQVSERGIKTEVEQKPEETESPRVQLRKVNERVKPEVELKPEETDSPRVQLRKVNERIKSEVQHILEETESPRVQLRRAGQTQPPAGSPKSEKRDSIFEQIRNKTFSLKSAVAGRPNIRPNIEGPRTNLKVAAILEKASTIRQAMVGSDEEDDADSWSDS